MPARPCERPSTSRLAGLDALRGIAALWVMYYHFLLLSSADHQIVGKGYVAVDFFFMLSGYVMARTYEPRLAGGYTVRRFMVARYRRLWPVMAIGTLIGAPMLALELGNPGPFAVIAVANLLLLPVFMTGGAIFPVNGAAWSIFAELTANLAHGVWLWRLRNAALAVFAALLVPALIWICLAFDTLNAGAGENSFLAGILRALFGYSAGILLWRVWKDKPPVRVPPFLAFATIPVIALLVRSLSVETWFFDLGFVLLASPFLIAGGLTYRGNHCLGRWLGAISFPLYAVHMPLMFWSKGLGLGPVSGVAAALALAAYIAMRTNPAAIFPRRGPEMTPAAAEGSLNIERGITLRSR
ncbi:MAG: acyltransferase [Novosphingobium sp.]